MTPHYLRGNGRKRFGLAVDGKIVQKNIIANFVKHGCLMAMLACHSTEARKETNVIQDTQVLKQITYQLEFVQSRYFGMVTALKQTAIILALKLISSTISSCFGTIKDAR